MAKKTTKRGPEEKHCADCGAIISRNAEICPKCGVRQAKVTPKGSSDQKSQTIALILSIFVGWLGVDRFYLGYIGLGILKLITIGGCGIWWLIDLILIAMNKLKDADGNELEK